jgi:AbiV family abortive infection protein
MPFKEDIEKLIPEPGCFIVFRGQDDQSSPKKESRKIEVKKETKRSKNAYEVFYNSKENSIDLLREAQLLLENGCYARAVALAIMSYEELGKSQIAADYYSGILPEDEYKKAFKTHKKTSFAGRHAAIGSHEKVKYGLFIDDNIARELELLRQSAFYVDETNNPSNNFSKEDAEFIIQKVKSHIEAIQHAEWLNQRIGSKALFK